MKQQLKFVIPAIGDTVRYLGFGVFCIVDKKMQDTNALILMEHIYRQGTAIKRMEKEGFFTIFAGKYEVIGIPEVQNEF
jgi:hypothetical protein